MSVAQRIPLIIVGAAGRMGSELVRAATNAEDIDVVAMVDTTPGFEDDLSAAIERTKPKVLVDFTSPEVGAKHALLAIRSGVAPVVGTSGLSEDSLQAIDALSNTSKVPAMVVPNFAIGAVLMMKFSEIAAEWMPNVEIIEMHHDKKFDAPSGTATSTAMRIAKKRKSAPSDNTREIKYEGARGASVAGIAVHSVRLPGMVAHQMVSFGAPGETLTIRHDSIDRVSFMDGVLLCARRIWTLDGLTIGLDRLLFE